MWELRTKGKFKRREGYSADCLEVKGGERVHLTFHKRVRISYFLMNSKLMHKKLVIINFQQLYIPTYDIQLRLRLLLNLRSYQFPLVPLVDNVAVLSYQKIFQEQDSALQGKIQFFSEDGLKLAQSQFLWSTKQEIKQIDLSSIFDQCRLKVRVQSMSSWQCCVHQQYRIRFLLADHANEYLKQRVDELQQKTEKLNLISKQKQKRSQIKDKQIIEAYKKIQTITRQKLQLAKINHHLQHKPAFKSKEECEGCRTLTSQFQALIANITRNNEILVAGLRADVELLEQRLIKQRKKRLDNQQQNLKLYKEQLDSIQSIYLSRQQLLKVQLLKATKEIQRLSLNNEDLSCSLEDQVRKKDQLQIQNNQLTTLLRKEQTFNLAQSTNLRNKIEQLQETLQDQQKNKKILNQKIQLLQQQIGKQKTFIDLQLIERKELQSNVVFTGQRKQQLQRNYNQLQKKLQELQMQYQSIIQKRFQRSDNVFNLNEIVKMKQIKTKPKNKQSIKVPTMQSQESLAKKNESNQIFKDIKKSLQHKNKKQSVFLRNRHHKSPQDRSFKNLQRMNESLSQRSRKSNRFIESLKRLRNQNVQSNSEESKQIQQFSQSFKFVQHDPKQKKQLLQQKNFGLSFGVINQIQKQIQKQQLNDRRKQKKRQKTRLKFFQSMKNLMAAQAKLQPQFQENDFNQKILKKEFQLQQFSQQLQIITRQYDKQIKTVSLKNQNLSDSVERIKEQLRLVNSQKQALQAIADKLKDSALRQQLISQKLCQVQLQFQQYRSQQQQQLIRQQERANEENELLRQYNSVINTQLQQSQQRGRRLKLQNDKIVHQKNFVYQNLVKCQQQLQTFKQNKKNYDDMLIFMDERRSELQRLLSQAKTMGQEKSDQTYKLHEQNQLVKEQLKRNKEECGVHLQQLNNLKHFVFDLQNQKNQIIQQLFAKVQAIEQKFQNQIEISVRAKTQSLEEQALASQRNLQYNLKQLVDKCNVENYQEKIQQLGGQMTSLQFKIKDYQQQVQKLQFQIQVLNQQNKHLSQRVNSFVEKQLSRVKENTSVRYRRKSIIQGQHSPSFSSRFSVSVKQLQNDVVEIKREESRLIDNESVSSKDQNLKQIQNLRALEQANQEFTQMRESQIKDLQNQILVLTQEANLKNFELSQIAQKLQSANQILLQKMMQFQNSKLKQNLLETTVFELTSVINELKSQIHSLSKSAQLRQQQSQDQLKHAQSQTKRVNEQKWLAQKCIQYLKIQYSQLVISQQQLQQLLQAKNKQIEQLQLQRREPLRQRTIMFSAEQKKDQEEFSEVKITEIVQKPQIITNLFEQTNKINQKPALFEHQVALQQHHVLQINLLASLLQSVLDESSQLDLLRAKIEQMSEKETAKEKQLLRLQERVKRKDQELRQKQEQHSKSLQQLKFEILQSQIKYKECIQNLQSQHILQKNQVLFKIQDFSRNNQISLALHSAQTQRYQYTVSALSQKIIQLATLNDQLQFDIQQLQQTNSQRLRENELLLQRYAQLTMGHHDLEDKLKEYIDIVGRKNQQLQFMSELNESHKRSIKQKDLQMKQASSRHRAEIMKVSQQVNNLQNKLSMADFNSEHLTLRIRQQQQARLRLQNNYKEFTLQLDKRRMEDFQALLQRDRQIIERDFRIQDLMTQLQNYFSQIVNLEFKVQQLLSSSCKYQQNLLVETKINSTFSELSSCDRDKLIQIQQYFRNNKITFDQDI